MSFQISSSDDSDATVAPALDKPEIDEEKLEHGDGVSEASLPSSPSILFTNNMAAPPVEATVDPLLGKSASMDTSNYRIQDEWGPLLCDFVKME